LRHSLPRVQFPGRCPRKWHKTPSMFCGPSVVCRQSEGTGLYHQRIERSCFHALYHPSFRSEYIANCCVSVQCSIQCSRNCHRTRVSATQNYHKNRLEASSFPVHSHETRRGGQTAPLVS